MPATQRPLQPAPVRTKQQRKVSHLRHEAAHLLPSSQKKFAAVEQLREVHKVASISITEGHFSARFGSVDVAVLLRSHIQRRHL